MLLSEKYKLICLNPPKTGSFFRELLFKKYNPHLGFFSGHGRHANLKQAVYFLNRRGLKPEDFYIFTFTRNPWVRAASWLDMTLNKHKQEHMTFDRICQRLKNWAKFGLYTNPDWGLNVDFIGDCEHQTEQIAQLFEKLGIPLHIPYKRLNRYMSNKYKWTTNKNDIYKSFYEKDPEAIKKIGNIERYIIDKKKYIFEL